MTTIAYQAKTYDYGKMIGAFRGIVNDFTGVPVVPTNKKKLPPYPYITYGFDPKTLEAWGNTHELELFRLPVTLNCYGDAPSDAVNMADDIETLLFDPNYHDKLKQAGIIVMSAVDNDASSSDFSGLFDVYTSSVIVTLRLLRNYVSDFPRITDTDIN